MSHSAIGKDNKLHFATDFYDGYIGDYFCPNEECGIQLVLKNLGSEEKEYKNIKPYFSAFPNKNHIENCEYRSRTVSRADLETSGFNIKEFFASIMNPKGGSAVANPQSQQMHNEKINNEHKENLLKTVNKLYQYCLQHSDYDTLPMGEKIYEIYQEKRNSQIPNNQRSLFRLVKLNFKNCNSSFDLRKGCYLIWCIFTHVDTTCPPGKYYWLCFKKENYNLMMELCEVLTPLKKKYGNDTSLPIIVAGEWENNSCFITSKRQIYIPNKP